MSINFGCFSIDIVDLTSRLCTCIEPHAAYVCKFKENLDALSTAKGGLTALQNEVNRKVDIAEVQQQEKRLETVQEWLSRVRVLEAEVEKFITVDGSQEIEKNCLGGCCPNNCWSRYRLGKKVAEKINEVTSLVEEGRKFTEVAGRQLLASGSAVERPSSEPVGLDSAFEEVKSYIGDEQVGIIGIYGMGGVGKTTLLTQINNNLRTNFDLVIWVVVSRNSTIEKVQDGIAESMGFNDDTWKNKSQAVKTRHIFGVLKGKKFMLLLDDIWERIDLVEVGVPIPKKHGNTSKIVFTTRSEDVCGRMKSKRQIKVNCLRPRDAWNLFLENVGEATINSHPDILEKAKIVVDECNGLPLALITIGQAMARKTTPQEWDRAGQVLKENAAKFLDMADRVLPLLKFSYDSLRSNTHKSCFLYCSIFPEDYLISKEKLIEYWIGEGFLDGFIDINEGYDIIGTLVRACLLEEDSVDSTKNTDFVPDMSGSVKMHDVIRDMALWIASDCGEGEDKFLVQERSILNKAPEIGKSEKVERMSLMHSPIEELIEISSCPNLLTLILNFNSLMKITDGFFQNMPNLRVLDLSSGCHFPKLPTRICELVSLQYLNFSYTGLLELPIEYKNLVNLKYLNLEYTETLDTIPQGLISCFKKLRVLKMHRCRYLTRKYQKEDSVLFGRIETFVKEVESLEELNHLSLSAGIASTLSRVLRSPKVLSCTKLLSIIRMDGLKYQDISILQSMRCLHKLVFLSCKDLEDFKVERAREGILVNSEIIESNIFHSLHCVNISRCWKLTDVTWLVFAPSLEILYLELCGGMEEVICGGKLGEASAGAYLNLFAKLRVINLIELPQLKSINLNPLPFPCLESMEAIECPNLKKLPLNSDSAKGLAVSIKGEKKWWNELEWEDAATQNAFLPFFRSSD